MRRAEDVLNGVSETEGREKHEWVNELQRQTDQLREAMEFQNRNLNTICTFHHCYHKVHFLNLLCVCYYSLCTIKSENGAICLLGFSYLSLVIIWLHFLEGQEQSRVVPLGGKAGVRMGRLVVSRTWRRKVVRNLQKGWREVGIREGIVEGR